VFETKDGSRFDTIADCEAYVLDKIGEELDGILRDHLATLGCNRQITRIMQMEVLKAFMGDIKTCKKVADIFNKHI
jgi:hypothetical protein